MMEGRALFRVIFHTIGTQPGGNRPVKMRNITEYECDGLDQAEEQANLIAETLADLHLTDVKCAWVKDGPMNKTTIMVNQLSHYEVEYTHHLVPCLEEE